MNYKTISVRQGNSDLLPNTTAKSKMHTKLGIISRRNGSVHSYSGDLTKAPWNGPGSAGHEQGQVTQETRVARYTGGTTEGRRKGTSKNAHFSIGSHRPFRRTDRGRDLAVKENWPLLVSSGFKFWNSFVSRLCFFPGLILPVPVSRPPVLWPSRLNARLC